MSGGSVQEVNAQEFDQIVSTSTVPVVADFWAPWCGPCRMQGPILESLAMNNPGAATIAKVDVDQEPELAMQFGVQSIPTLLVINNGKLHRRLVGLQSESVLKNALADAANS